MTIDDNEYHHARTILDEVFGEQAHIASIVWQARYSVSNDASVSNSHNYILVYSKTPEAWKKLRNEIDRDELQSKQYSNPDDDPEGPWRAIPWDAPNIRENLSYPITTPRGTVKYPPPGRCWAREETKWNEIVDQGLSYFGKSGDGAPSFKRYLKNAETVVPTTWWPHENSGHTDEASKELTAFGLQEKFATPKPVRLLEKILRIATNPESIVLDSFAGSGSTAHAVERVNQSDNGYRTFILVEGEEYADRLTAERVRRVMNGYSFSGSQREILFERQLTWTEIKKGDALRKEADNIKDASRERFDNIKIEVKEGALKVIGERTVQETAPGLGGSFTYCTLGDPVKLDQILAGNKLPERDKLADWLVFTAMGTMEKGEPIQKLDAGLKDKYLGRFGDTHAWLLYEPNSEFLQSPEAALTRTLAQQIHRADPHSRHLVFSPTRFVSAKVLAKDKLSVDHALIPFSLFQLDRGS